MRSAGTPAILEVRYPRGGVRGSVHTRVLVAYDDEYRAYREVIAAGIAVLRPHVAVATSTPNELERELERFAPQVVVCGRPGNVDTGDRPAWVELPLEPERRAKVRVGERRWESPYLLLEGLLAIIDEAEQLVSKNADRTSNREPLGHARSNEPSSQQRGRSLRSDGLHKRS